jgi:D-alanyl-D-alanine carboxypeptidase/D-alanyl-D-alanine-endopeptidase (penicillin-binding protein 4)
VSIFFAHSQVAEKVGAAYRRFAADAQMKYASHSLLVVETKTGKTVFSSNENTGLAPASTLKVVTAATALQTLGAGFVFQTPFLLTGEVSNGVFNGDIVIKSSGDPTAGSWRYASTKDFSQIAQIAEAMDKAGIKKWNGSFIVDNAKFGTQGIPGGWTFDDMGNYYGAGVHGFNWYENQYDLVLNPGSAEGQGVKMAGTRPIPNAVNLTNELSSGAKGSGDQAIIFPDGEGDGTVRGTVPAGVKEFVISGSIKDPGSYFQKSLRERSNQKGYTVLQQAKVKTTAIAKASGKTLSVLLSPGLDSIVYFFLQKSVNLYGEALVKQLALKAGKEANTAEGIKWLRDYWEAKGIERGALRIVDGSGLSPHNRVTTRTLVTVMQDAKKQTWYPAFYEGLPLINGIKMKSGSISGVRGYTGYVQSADGTEYTFAFLVNNFDGTSSAVMQKMFNVLNGLK